MTYDPFFLPVLWVVVVSAILPDRSYCLIDHESRRLGRRFECRYNVRHDRVRLHVVSPSQALLWTLTAVAIVLSIGRFLIRYVTASRFYLDDASHLLSLLFLIGLAAAYTSGFPYSVRIARISRKEETAPPPADPFYHTYLQHRLVVTLLVFMVLWSVKATFLIFYRLLFDVSKTFIRMWWAAVALVFATFWVCIGSTLTLCGSASDLYDFSMRLPLPSLSMPPPLTVSREMLFPRKTA